MPRPNVSPAMVVAIVALIAATAGTALAATGQLVNLVDPSNAANAARVDAQGALKTTSTVAGSVKKTEAVSFNRSKTVGNFFGPAGNVEVLNTTATLALYRMKVTLIGADQPWIGALFVVQGKADGTCGTSGPRITTIAVKPDESVVDPLPAPLILKPAVAGQPVCLRAQIGPKNSSSIAPGDVVVDVSGTVLGGTFTDYYTAAKTAARSDRDRASSVLVAP